MNKKVIGLIFLAIIGLIIISGELFFIVDQRSQAIVLQFGELRHVYRDPGLKIKVPFIQEVTYYEKRVLDFDLPEVRITTGDQKRMFVDTYTRYRISDPILFFRSIKPANEQGAAMRLEALISSTVRNVLGKIELRTLLSEERSKIMGQINREVQKLTESLGIEIIDVRIIRTELPPENRKAVFARMNSELERIAKENRAKGFEKALEIKSTAEKDRTILIAEAQKQAQTAKGEGDSKAVKIAADAAASDPEFFIFDRSMQALKESLKQGTTTMILGTDSDFFKYFSNPDKHLTK
jgi:membrane protease subunit HflC